MPEDSESQPNKKPTVADGPILREHTYDGIQEYDQKLPNWWLASWYIFIVYFVIYWFLYYQIDLFADDEERVKNAVAVIETKKATELEKLMASLDDDVLWRMSQNSKIVEAGKTTYQTTCVACHGTDLSATLNGVKLPGEPLNDSEWKYGARPMEIFGIVKNGSPDVTKGMVAWEPSLGPKKVAEVVAFVLSFHTPPAEASN